MAARSRRGQFPSLVVSTLFDWFETGLGMVGAHPNAHPVGHVVM